MTRPSAFRAPSPATHARRRDRVPAWDGRSDPPTRSPGGDRRPAAPEAPDAGDGVFPCRNPLSSSSLAVRFVLAATQVLPSQRGAGSEHGGRLHPPACSLPAGPWPCQALRWGLEVVLGSAAPSVCPQPS